MRYIILAILISALLIGCAKEPQVPEPVPHTPEPEAPVVVEVPQEEVEVQVASEHEVIIDKKLFDPAELTIEVGDTVTWRKIDTLKHRIASDEQEDEGKLSDGLMFASENELYGDGTYSVTFNQAGSYTYRDVVYGTRGTIIVEETG